MAFKHAQTLNSSFRLLDAELVDAELVEQVHKLHTLQLDVHELEVSIQCNRTGR